MISVLVIVMEAITMWLCLHIAFGEKIKRTKGEVVFFIPYVVVCVLCAYELISKVFYLGLWVFVFAWCKVMFGQKVFGSIIRTAIGVIAVGVIETIVMYVYAIFTYGKNWNVEVECMIACGFVLFITSTLYILINNVKNVSIKNLFDKNTLVLVIIIAAFLLYVKLEFEINRTIPIIYVFFFSMLAMSFLFLCKKQKDIFELEKKNLNLELQSMYGNAYEDLLNEVRRKQHDYKNQLTALYSMYTTASNFEELKKMHKDYLGVIEVGSEFDHILTMCNNSIISGYLYSMGIRLKNDGIRLNTDINIIEKDINVKTKYVVEILGILLTNATEYLSEHTMFDRCIDLKMYQENDKMYIEVNNQSEYMSYDTLGKMFDNNYSTKGNGRGIGLTSLKNIVEKCDGELHVDNISEDKGNILRFSLRI